MPRLQATLQGAREVGFTVLSMSISLVAVFLPILLMGGIVGRYLPRIRGDADHRDHHLADRVADHHADAVRLSRFAHARAQDRDWLLRRSERAFEGAQRFYERRSLNWSLDNPSTIMFVLLVDGRS